MELGAAEGEGLDETARHAFAGLMERINGLLRDALSEGAGRGDAEAAALHIATVTRGLAVLERAFGDEAQLRKIAAHTVDLVLGKSRLAKGSHLRASSTARTRLKRNIRNGRLS